MFGRNQINVQANINLQNKSVYDEGPQNSKYSKTYSLLRTNKQTTTTTELSPTDSRNV